jgi:hypothetical protein
MMLKNDKPKFFSVLFWCFFLCNGVNQKSCHLALMIGLTFMGFVVWFLGNGGFWWKFSGKSP